MPVGAPRLRGGGQPRPEAQVTAFVDRWHDDAAHARPAYFDRRIVAGHGTPRSLPERAGDLHR
jgi:hypothetical protein